MNFTHNIIAEIARMILKSAIPAKTVQERDMAKILRKK
jgi:hypothetical protein